MWQKALTVISSERYTVLFALHMGGLYLLPGLFGGHPWQPTPTWFFVFLTLSYLMAVLFRSCYRTRTEHLAGLPDRMEPPWLFKLIVFCIEWVKAIAGAVLVIWWIGGLLFIHDFFSQYSLIIPWLVSLLHSILIYLLAQLNQSLFDLISFGATQD
ncbi:hypothetical protein C2E25_12610 [Geothermobacter hydrogeniphilus]|uniref:Uncharacterized protein n=1 Tax=Geothermobacter hydrogeniphilus TaxID=1969733 RepID=A0A2K2H7X8_9BACT|nr:hypothetical protein [Geothermobacter hydrogeniphilus]PNU19415.1 hypothetical protein C2E25_12610 [Geothermobacter hydrogeniphilus]